MERQGPADIWMAPVGTTAPEGALLELVIEMIRSLEPLDEGFGSYPAKTVPDTLRDVLFGQSGATEAVARPTDDDSAAKPPLATYAILDAARIEHLPELLANSGLEHRCLFKGEAEMSLGQAAPWIVRLEADSPFTRYLFTKGQEPWHLWDRAAGIYARAGDDLAGLWSHFRKFSFAEDEAGKRFYLRFWDPLVLTALVRVLTVEQLRLFCGKVDCIVAVLPEEARAEVMRLRPGN